MRISLILLHLLESSQVENAEEVLFVLTNFDNQTQFSPSGDTPFLPVRYQSTTIYLLVFGLKNQWLCACFWNPKRPQIPNSAVSPDVFQKPNSFFNFFQFFLQRLNRQLSGHKENLIEKLLVLFGRQNRDGPYKQNVVIVLTFFDLETHNFFISPIKGLNQELFLHQNYSIKKNWVSGVVIEFQKCY